MNEIEKRIDKMIKRSEVILNAGKQTNEEWFTNLSTEEKAKAIVCLAHNASALAIEYHCADSDVDAIKMWLKEVHK